MQDPAQMERVATKKEDLELKTLKDVQQLLDESQVRNSVYSAPFTATMPHFKRPETPLQDNIRNIRDQISGK